MADTAREGIVEFPCDVERLPDGNTLITDAGDERGEGSEIVEVDPEGRIVPGVQSSHVAAQPASVVTALILPATLHEILGRKVRVRVAGIACGVHDGERVVVEERNEPREGRMESKEPVEFEGRRVRPRRVFEGEHRIVLDLLDQRNRLGEIGFRFSGEAYDYIHPNGDILIPSLYF